ncbi:hypothetical protein RUM43_013507 [Polyplax serrata]|uniref:Uncharacterized protein n=1 Tax=Polyplax serrata TaxID=468196 RepID=A0AAN8P0S1_POLSC
MGCASSAALPFLTVKENRAVVDPANMNGKTSHDLEMVTNKLGSRGLDSISDMNESFVSEKMKEVVDSSTVQGVIGSVVQVKDDVCNQVKVERHRLITRKAFLIFSKDPNVDHELLIKIFLEQLASRKIFETLGKIKQHTVIYYGIMSTSSQDLEH